MIRSSELSDTHVDTFLNAIYELYGYDYREYSKPSIKRRIVNRMNQEGYTKLSDMLSYLVNHPNFMDTLVLDFSINVTEMFRDPFVFSYIQDEVFPFLETYPFIRIWVAGCSSGEEVYSLAIALHEWGIYDRVQIYATDINEKILEQAILASYPIENKKKYETNYISFGGKSSFSDYVHIDGLTFSVKEFLKKRIMFSTHNLVTDGTFNEMHLILCRNVMIYFNQTLKQRVFNLFSDSMVEQGYLCIGTKETIEFFNEKQKFESMNERARLYRKV